MKYDCYPRFLKSDDYHHCWELVEKGHCLPEMKEPFLKSPESCSTWVIFNYCLHVANSVQKKHYRITSFNSKIYFYINFPVECFFFYSFRRWANQVGRRRKKKTKMIKRKSFYYHGNRNSQAAKKSKTTASTKVARATKTIRNF